MHLRQRQAKAPGKGFERSILVLQVHCRYAGNHRPRSNLGRRSARNSGHCRRVAFVNMLRIGTLVGRAVGASVARPMSHRIPRSGKRWGGPRPLTQFIRKLACKQLASLLKVCQ